MRNQQSGFMTMSDTYHAVQVQKQARSLKFQILKEEILFYGVKTKVLISCVITTQLICRLLVFWCCGSNCNYQSSLRF